MIVIIENTLEVTMHVSAVRTAPKHVEITVADIKRIGNQVDEVLWQGNVAPGETLKLRGFQGDEYMALTILGFGNDDVVSQMYESAVGEEPFTKFILTYADPDARIQAIN